jgi:hypothetical protein
MTVLHVFDECREGNHDDCPKWMNFSAEHIAQDVCSCECHMEIVVVGVSYETMQRVESVAATLIGLDEASASSAAEEAGMTIRVEQRDGKRLGLRRDFRTNRINLTVERERVVATRVG